MVEFNRAFDEQGGAEKPDLDNLEFLLSIIEDRSNLVVLVAQLKSEILKLKFMSIVPDFVALLPEYTVVFNDMENYHHLVNHNFTDLEMCRYL